MSVNSLKNIKLIRVITLLSWLLLYISIQYPFFIEQGFSAEQFFLWNATFSLFMGICEIPSGYFADRFGRVKAMQLGSFLVIFPLLLYPFLHNFGFYLILNFVSALGFALTSGANIAIVYDSLLEAKSEERFIRERSVLDGISSFSESGGAILVSLLLIFGIISGDGLRWVLWISAVVSFLSFLCCLFLVEPHAHSEKFNKSGWYDIWMAMKFTFVKNKKLRALIFANTIFSVTTLTSIWLAQPFFLEQSIDIKYFGLLWAFLQLPVGIASLFTPNLEKKLGAKLIPLLLSVVIMVSFFSLGLKMTTLGILAYVLLAMVRGVKQTYFSNMINHLIFPKLRATILSLESMLFRLGYMFFGSISGVLIGVFSLSTTFIIFGAVFGGLGIFFYLILRRF